MDDNQYKSRHKDSPQTKNIIEFTDALKKCIEKPKNLVKPKFQARFSVYLKFIDNYRSLLARSKDKLSTIHYPWFLQIYKGYYNIIPSIIDKEIHGTKDDFMLNKQFEIWICKGTPKEKENYRLPIGAAFEIAIGTANRFRRLHVDDKEMNLDLQLPMLDPWEIKYRFMKVLCDALIDKDPENPDIEDMKSWTKQLKKLANLTKEQTKENMKNTVSDFAKTTAGLMGMANLKDKNGKPINFASSEAIQPVVSLFTDGSMGEILGDAFSDVMEAKTPDEAFDNLADKIAPVTKKVLLKIPKPEGHKEKEGGGNSISDVLFDKTKRDRIKKGLNQISQVFSEDTDSKDKEKKTRSKDTSNSGSDSGSDSESNSDSDSE